MRRTLAALSLLIALSACTGSEPETMDRTPPADPATIERTGRPNDFLACPPDRCAAVADEVSKTYPVAARQLIQDWLGVVSSMEGAQLVRADQEQMLFEFEQKSDVFRFRDTILVKIIPLGPDESTLIYYSRSNVGYWDLGVNKQRGRNWLDQLDYVVARGIELRGAQPAPEGATGAPDADSTGSARSP